MVEAGAKWVLSGDTKDETRDNEEKGEDAYAGDRPFGIVAGPGVGKTTVASVAFTSFHEANHQL